jgi:F420-dependent oxidoreductase-like protein
LRFGALLRGDTVEEMAADARIRRDSGYNSAWLTDGVGVEPLTAIAAIGRMVEGIELGTSVVRTLPRHPMVLGQQALTVNAIIGGRLALGIGPSHRPAVEQGWGIIWDRPVERMRDYLSILVPLVRDGAVSYRGETVAGEAEFHIAGATPCPVLLGALGPRMLELAGALADGTVTFQVGPRTLAGLTCPTIRGAAERAGRPTPRVVSMISMCVTDDVGSASERARRASEAMAALPSYAAMLQREGGPALIAGDEDRVIRELRSLEAAGVTDVIPLRLARRGSEDEERTEGLLSDVVRSGLGAAGP